jgi:hypothetical protein
LVPPKPAIPPGTRPKPPVLYSITSLGEQSTPSLSGRPVGPRRAIVESPPRDMASPLLELGDRLPQLVEKF